MYGEGVLKDEVVMFGCEDGVLFFDDGVFIKIEVFDLFGCIGNVYVFEISLIVFGDYKIDLDVEGYLLL